MNELTQMQDTGIVRSGVGAFRESAVLAFFAVRQDVLYATFVSAL